MLVHFTRLLSARARSDRGATAVEYGLLAALVAAVAIAAVILLGSSLDPLFGGVAADAGGTAP